MGTSPLEDVATGGMVSMGGTIDSLAGVAGWASAGGGPFFLLIRVDCQLL